MRILNEKEVDMKGFNEKWERIFMAVAFAEAGEHETAREIMREKDTVQKREMKSSRKITRATPHR